MEEDIIEILYKHSCSVLVRSIVLKDVETEEWLWSGEFEKVAKEIANRFARLPKRNES